MWELYNKKAVIKYIAGLFAIAMAMYLTGGSGFALIIPIMLYALIAGNVEIMLYTVLICVAMISGNNTLMPKNIVFALCQRSALVILGICMMSKVFGIRTYPVARPLLWLFPYLIYMIIPSSQGWSPMVSFLKLFLFVVIFMAYLGVSKIAFYRGGDMAVKLRSMVLSVAIFFIVGSIALIPFPGISYMSPEEVLKGSDGVSLFAGMTWHSQFLGPIIVAFFVFLLADLVFNIRRPDKLYLSLLLCCPYLVYKTSSRTAMGTMIATSLFILWLAMSMRGSIRWRMKVVNSFVLIGVCLVAIGVCVPQVRQGVVKYALKKYSGVSENEKINTDEVMSTRQFLIDSELANWRKKMMIGNGFQVSEAMQYQRRGSVLSYLSAPIEKGVWVTAILEEGGIVGMILFCMFWLPALIVLKSKGGYVTASLLCAMIVSNLGEFSFFSMSSEGGTFWALIFCGATLDGVRVSNDKMLLRQEFRPVSVRI